MGTGVIRRELAFFEEAHGAGYCVSSRPSFELEPAGPLYDLGPMVADGPPEGSRGLPLTPPTPAGIGAATWREILEAPSTHLAILDAPPKSWGDRRRSSRRRLSSGDQKLVSYSLPDAFKPSSGSDPVVLVRNRTPTRDQMVFERFPDGAPELPRPGLGAEKVEMLTDLPCRWRLAWYLRPQPAPEPTDHFLAEAGDQQPVQVDVPSLGSPVEGQYC
jgi:hypothetical protein